MYKKILVPLDGSALAAAILPHVREIVRYSHAQVVLLRITPEPVHFRADIDPKAPHWTDTGPKTMSGVSWTVMSAPMQRMESIEHEVETAQTYMDDIARELSDDGIHVQVLVKPGAVANAILEAVDDEQVDLIAMSTHGRSGLNRFLLGSVADRVVHYANVPVLLVRSGNNEHGQVTNPDVVYKRILVPLDGSELANEILPHIQQLALGTNAEVLLLRVVHEPMDWPDDAEAFMFSAGLVRTGTYATAKPEPTDTPRAKKIAYTLESAQASLDVVATALTRAGLRVETLVQIGHSAQTILEVAARCHPDMIAMSTHGRSGLRRFLMGSVATQVLEHASVPLLLVRHHEVDSVGL